ncbi:unnamed protein product [Rotaria sordida]|uniref:Ubiquitin-like domain-containing protein n=1 Tax=Rotaria sordida TaxID=392033 RepID=A0A814IWI0_9BILA|nr:unnamed protein product [Rotaria sordida]
MSFIEGIGDDLLHAFCFILFIGIVSFAWLSSHVNYIHLPTTLFIIERRIHRRNEEQQLEINNSVSSTNEPIISSSSSVNETLIEHESDIESNENDELMNEQISISTESNTNQIQQYQSNNIINSNEIISQITTIEEEEEEDQSLRITIKFLNDTQKSIIANPNDTISKIKRLYFADELTNNKIVRFIYQGRELQDNETLRTCNIRDQTIIHCQISTRRLSTINRVNNDISTTHRNMNTFDTLSFIDTSPIYISPYFIFFITLILGSVWYLRIKYRLLFTPISTIILLLITIILLIFTCGILLTTRRQISNIRIPTHLHHVHLD